MKYSIDTSAIIDGRVRYYPPDVFPGVWDKIEELVDQGLLVASEFVLLEIAKVDDDAHKWAKQHKHMFVPADNETQLAAERIINVSPGGHHKPLDQKSRVGADPFVIALAQVAEYNVVTGERPSKKQKWANIPDVCEALGIRCLNMPQLFREQGWIFRL